MMLTMIKYMQTSIYFLVAFEQILSIYGSSKFPYQKFFNISDSGLAKHISERYLCTEDKEKEGKSSLNTQKCCRCDANCWYDRSCCIDIEWEQKPIASLDVYVQKVINKQELILKGRRCLPLLESTDLLFIEHVLMIDHCPLAGKSSLDVTYCNENTLNETHIPVKGNDGYLYKNKYCASCNAISSYETIPLLFSCNQSVSMLDSRFDAATKNPLCTLRVDHSRFSSTHHIACDDRFETDKCKIGSKEYKLCKSYKGIVNSIYLNIHCMRCIDHTEIINASLPCYPRVLLASRPENSFAYSTLIRIGGDKGCSKGKVWDWSINSCTSVRCQPGYFKDGSTCKRQYEITTSKKGNSFMNCLVQSSLTLYAKMSSAQPMQLLNKKSYGKSHSLWTILPHWLATGEPILKYNNTFNVSNFLESITAGIFWKNGIKQIYLTSVPDIDFNRMYGFDLTKYFPKLKICSIASSRPASQVEFKENCLLNIDGIEYGTDDYVQAMIVTKKVTKQYIYTCKKYHLHSDCLQLSLNYSDTRMKLYEEYMVFDGRKLDASKYVPIGDMISLCLRSTRSDPTWLLISNKVEQFVTVTGIMFSLVGYTITIVIYGIAGELRSVPSFALVSLCLSLIVTDICVLIFIFGSIDYHNYKLLAISMHWSSLATSAWIITICREYLKMLLSSVHPINVKKWKHIVVQLLAGWLFPTVTVAATVAIDNFYPRLIDYGKDPGSFIRNYTAKLVTHVIPVSFALGTSCILVLLTIVQLQQHRRSTLMIQSNRSNTNCANLNRRVNVNKVIVKLCIMLGVGEILGLIQVNNDVADVICRMLYSFLRSFRGFFIFVVFVLKKRILVILKGKVVKKEETAITATESRIQIATNNID